jgi:hypothetical protein
MIRLYLKILLIVRFANLTPIEEQFFFVSDEINPDTATRFTETKPTSTAILNVSTSATSPSTALFRQAPSNLQVEIKKENETWTATITTYGPVATAGFGLAVFFFTLLIAYKKILTC